MSREYRYIRFFQDIRIDDVPSVGGKNASLGEMYRELTASGVRVPNGFAVTAQAYWYVLEQAGIQGALRNALEGLRPDDVDDLAKRGRRARELIYSAPLPADLQSEILDAYRRLQREYGPALSVAVRSSATAEDLPDVSFAGMHESYLNIEGDEHLLEACRRCLASLFTDRAIHYRIDEGFDHFKVALSICVMKMVRSDLAASGVMFSIETESGFPDVAFDYDERDAGVKEMIRLAVEGCKRNRRHSGLCGQAPSDYPEMAQYLVEVGIDSMSLNPDAVLKTTLRVLELERRLGRSAR